MQTCLICFCPKENYKLDRFLAWADVTYDNALVKVISLSLFRESANRLKKDYPRLNIEVIPYPESSFKGYYCPENFPDTLKKEVTVLDFTLGVVFPSGPPIQFRYIPEYTALPIKPDYNYFSILHRLGIRDVLSFDVNGIQRHNIPYMLDDFEDRHKGKRAWIVGNGPSLKQLDMSLLKSEVTFGSNRVYLGFEGWGFATTYWCIVDSLQFEKYTREWELNIPDSCLKFFPFEYLNLFHIKNGCPVNFYPPGHPENRWNFNNPYKQIELSKPHGFSITPDIVYLGHTVTYAMLQIAVIMGCDPIFLIGCDHNYKISLKDKLRGLWQDARSSNHFHEAYCFGNDGQRKFHLPEPVKSEAAFDYSNTWAKANGRTIMNATPGSRLKSFPMITYTEALETGIAANLDPVPPIKPECGISH